MTHAGSPLPATHRDDAVTAVSRALGILEAFGMADSHLSLAEMARRTRLPKPTVLRLARTLSLSGYLVSLEGGSWRLGPAAARLGARYQRGFDLHNLIEPALQKLAEATGRSTSFFALEEGQRVRMLRVRGKDGFVTPTLVGEPLPLEKGAAGQVILAFTGERGRIFSRIREQGWHLTVGEADAGSASIAAPVHAASRMLLGAMSVAAPADDASVAELRRHIGALVEAARLLSNAFVTDAYKSKDATAVRSLWFPT